MSRPCSAPTACWAATSWAGATEDRRQVPGSRSQSHLASTTHRRGHRAPGRSGKVVPPSTHIPAQRGSVAASRSW
jgi:hypothetical protein